MLDTRLQTRLEPKRIEAGDRIQVKLGAIVHSTDPKISGTRINRSRRPVVVENAFDERGLRMVTWTSGGSYWSWALDTDVDFFD